MVLCNQEHATITGFQFLVVRHSCFRNIKAAIPSVETNLSTNLSKPMDDSLIVFCTFLKIVGGKLQSLLIDQKIAFKSELVRPNNARK